MEEPLLLKQLRKAADYTSMGGKLYKLVDGSTFLTTSSGLLHDALLNTKDLTLPEQIKHRDAENILASYIFSFSYIFILRSFRFKKEDAEDISAKITQQVMKYLRDKKYRDGNVGVRNLRGLLARSTRNKVYDFFREPRHRGLFVSLESLLDNDEKLAFFAEGGKAMQFITDMNKAFSEAINYLWQEERLTDVQRDLLGHRFGLADFKHIPTIKAIAKELNRDEKALYRDYNRALEVLADYIRFDNEFQALLDYE